MPVLLLKNIIGKDHEFFKKVELARKDAETNS
jgi:hypothetical protein